jgi:hypothetical protein
MQDYACAVFSGGFTSYLRNGWSVKLRAIENCFFSIRSIERNMRPILQTVYGTYAAKVPPQELYQIAVCVRAVFLPQFPRN